MIRDCLVATLKRVWPADLRSGTGFSAGAGGGGGTDSAQRKHMMVTLAQLKEAEMSWRH